jgi:hypothetical protein
MALGCLALAHSAIAAPDSVAPADQTISGTKPYTDSYTVTVTSPSMLNNAGDTQLANGGINLTVSATPLTWPSGSSSTQAAGLLSGPGVPPALAVLNFTAVSQDRSFLLTVTTTAGTIPGDYTYDIGGASPGGYGWGVTTAMLTVQVAEPTVSDTTPPAVTFASPATCPATYTFGQSVSININAVEDMSPITAFTATINGDAFGSATGIGTQSANINGTFTPSMIGTYTVAASATSVGGTGNASCDLNVNYDLTWLPPISLGKTSKGGSTMPIKFAIRDASGEFVTDDSVHVIVKEGATEVFSAFFGEGASNVRISETDEQYIVNFQTASGVHNYDVLAYFDGVGGEVLQGTKTFSTR